MAASPSDGIIFACDGTLYFGGITTDAVYSYWGPSYTPLLTAPILDRNSTTMQWVDTFAIDDNGGLVKAHSVALTHILPTRHMRPIPANQPTCAPPHALLVL